MFVNYRSVLLIFCIRGTLLQNNKGSAPIFTDMHINIYIYVCMKFMCIRTYIEARASRDDIIIL